MRKVCSLALTVVLMVLLTACGRGKLNITMSDGLSFGKVEFESVSILGVTYDLYTEGYACITDILHENAQFSETVTYENKEYSVVAIGYIKNRSDEHISAKGVFGISAVYTTSPDPLILPDSIKYIESYALKGCSASTIILPDGVISLGEGCFAECTNIESVEIPDSVTSIGGMSMFSGCTSLKTVTFPENCQIGTLANCFLECSSLESVTIPVNVVSLGTLAFYNCYELTSVIMEDGEDGIDTILESTFTNCPKLTTIVFPESVTSINSKAIVNCTGLTDITLPDGLLDIPSDMIVDEYYQPVEGSGLTIHVEPDLVSYVQDMYPAATVVAK